MNDDFDKNNDYFDDKLMDMDKYDSMGNPIDSMMNNSAPNNGVGNYSYDSNSNYNEQYNHSYARKPIDTGVRSIPAFNVIFSATNLLIIINVIVFFIMESQGDTENAYFLYEKGGAMAFSIFKQNEYYRLFTSMFMHAGFMHLFNNMITFFFVGNYIESEFGRVRFAILYLGSGLIGGYASMTYYRQIGEWFLVGVGASGAIFGIVGALLLYGIIMGLKKDGTFSVRNLLIYIGLSIYTGATNSGISLSAHIGGLISGFVLAFLLKGFSMLKRKNAGI